MKKIILILTAISLFTVSCKQEYENWYSATYELDGMYDVESSLAGYGTVYGIEDGAQLLIYGTAANVKDEIWIETDAVGSSVKAKFKISGDSKQFGGINTEAENIHSSSYYMVGRGGYHYPVGHDSIDAPDTAGIVVTDAVQGYTRVTLVEGKITPKIATTVGGNISDSVSVKILLYSDYVHFISYEIPVEDWRNPDVPEYDWKVVEGSNTPIPAEDGWDETWTFRGYRHTGFPEDQPQL